LSHQAGDLGDLFVPSCRHGGFYQIHAEGLGDEGLRTVSTQKMMLLK
jgi:hypothetical protein